MLSCSGSGMLPGKFGDDPLVDPSIANSFQAMMAWDSSRTFACFLYPTGGIEWAQSLTMLALAAVVRVLLCTFLHSKVLHWAAASGRRLALLPGFLTPA